MHPLRRILPSLNCLYAIDAVARHKSFTAAARELGLSQPAVSKAIRTAERHLGHELFVRRQGGLVLTARGRVLADEIGLTLSRLTRAATAPEASDRRQTLILCFSPSFVAMWLLPRLAEFTAVHPEIGFTITEASNRAYPSEVAFDFSSRLGDGAWPDVTAWEYAPEILFAVASPAYIAAHPEATDIGTLHRATLLHAIEAGRQRMGWAGWFEAVGQPVQGLSEGMVFSGYHATIQAALLGQGVALGWAHLVARHVQEGQLRFVTGIKVRTGRKFFLVAPAGHAIGPHHALFRDWVIGQARADMQRLHSIGLVENVDSKTRPA